MFPLPEFPGLKRSPATWLVTGVAGFIGSHLLEALLAHDQRVIGLDNFATGRKENLEDVKGRVTSGQWARFRFIEGDIARLEVCQGACAGVDYVLHQAALGSVPRSLAEPVRAHESNVTGFLHMLVAARDQRVRRFVYASSSSVYGDDPRLPKQEEHVGQPLSPYAATKRMNELYAEVFARCYGLQCVGLRYFNVFGPRQDPAGPYAAVIPQWIGALMANRPARIYGDGTTSRDFCYVANAVQANLQAATTKLDTPHEVVNVAVNARTSLNDLFEMVRVRLEPRHPRLRGCKPVYVPFRPGDILHSQADIGKAVRLLGYHPTHTVDQGLDLTVQWFADKSARAASHDRSADQNAR